MATLEDIARELYALPPAGFTAARTARAMDVKADDPVLAREVGALKRASVPAWVVGQLVRHRAAEIDRALALALELQDAQAELDGSALAELTKTRRQLTAALAREGAALARGARVAVSTGALDEVAQTLQAAMTDAAAAAAVTSGRLIRSLQTVGFDPVDLDGAVAGGAADAGARVSPSRDDLAERRAKRVTHKALRDADQATTSAERQLAKIDAQLHRARDRESALHEARDGLESELARILTQCRELEADQHRLEDERRMAAAAHKTAAKRLEKARSEMKWT